jgi:hypothetical protein
MFTVIWLIVYSVGLPVQILIQRSVDLVSQTSFIAFMLYTILSYPSSIVAVVWVSIIKRRMFLGIIENILEADNKLRYTHQEETYKNRKVMFNIISEIILLTVTTCISIIYNIYRTASEMYYIIFIVTISYAPDICNALIMLQFVN